LILVNYLLELRKLAKHALAAEIISMPFIATQLDRLSGKNNNGGNAWQ
jgi:hypothetical protein